VKWTIIDGELQIRLEAGKPEFYSRNGLSLEQVVEVVSYWTRSHDDEQAEAWLEAAEEELDLQKRTERILDDPVLAMLGITYTRDEARSEAIREREFERGEKALTAAKHDVALKHLRPLAERGHSHAQFYMGIMCAKGLGVPQDYIQAYVWLDLAARTQINRFVEARDKVAKRLSADELAEAQRIAAGWTGRAQLSSGEEGGL